MPTAGRDNGGVVMDSCRAVVQTLAPEHPSVKPVIEGGNTLDPVGEFSELRACDGLEATTVTWSLVGGVPTGSSWLSPVGFR